jgi:HlyD family secretion protein
MLGQSSDSAPLVLGRCAARRAGFRTGSRPMLWFRLILGAALITATWSAAARLRGQQASVAADALESVAVRFGDLETTILTGGELIPLKQTEVACDVEDVTDSYGTMILSVIENGAHAKKGDELCRFDSSELAEVARQQEISVERSRALFDQARLDLETAGFQLREYQEGLVTETTKEFEGRIAFARSDVEKLSDRVAWTSAMVAKGYLAEGRRLSERQSLAQARHDLRKVEGEFELFRRFRSPKEIRSLRAQIEAAENTLGMMADRLKAEEADLTYLRKQIANCTVRSPQDGIVIYANGSKWRSMPIEPGTRAFQGQVLFVLSDLRQMEVLASVHETMALRIRVGMRATARVASMSDVEIPGRVTSIDMLPHNPWRIADDDVKHFLVRIRLDSTPSCALPFMSASVVIDTGRIENALVIPVEAVSAGNGQQFCYVVASRELHRRPITTRRSTTELVEITGGLSEGERVVARCSDVDTFAVDKGNDGL